MKGHFPGHEFESVFKSQKRFNHKPEKAAYNTPTACFRQPYPNDLQQVTLVRMA